MPEAFDPYYDFHAECPGRDIDAYSPTVKRYHRLLWSKRLPSGASFDLEMGRPGAYLRHESDLGTFVLGSDQIIRTFEPVLDMAQVLAQLTASERAEFTREASSFGGLIVFPVGLGYTMNQARGRHPRLKDRFDLTLECIRRHYTGEPSPLSAVTERYAAFFGLFGDFRGYVDFFHLQDLVTPDAAEVRFFSPWRDFTDSPLLPDVESYRAYRDRTIDFIHARNRRLVEWVTGR